MKPRPETAGAIERASDVAKRVQLDQRLDVRRIQRRGASDVPSVGLCLKVEAGSQIKPNVPDHAAGIVDDDPVVTRGKQDISGRRRGASGDKAGQVGEGVSRW